MYQSSRTDSKKSLLICDQNGQPIKQKTRLFTRNRVCLFLAVVGTVCYISTNPNQTQGNKNFLNEQSQNNGFDGLISTAQLSTDIPASNSQYFVNEDYEGLNFNLTGVNEKKNLDGGFGVFDKKISSFKIGKGRRVQLCKNIGCKVNSPEDQIELIGPYESGKLGDIDNWIRAINTFPYDEFTEPRLQVLGKSNFHPITGSTFPYKKGCYTQFDLKNSNIGFQKEQGITSFMIPPSMDVQFFKSQSCLGKPIIDLSGPLNYDLTNPTIDPNHADLDDTIKSFVITQKKPLYIYLEWENLGFAVNSQQNSVYFTQQGLTVYNKNLIPTPVSKEYTAFDQIQYALNNQFYFMNETYNKARVVQASQIVKGDTFIKLSQQTSQDILNKFAYQIAENDKSTKIKLQNPCPPQSGQSEKGVFVLKIKGVVDNKKVLEIGTDEVQCVYTQKKSEIQKLGPMCPPTYCKEGDLKCESCEDF